MSQKVSSPVRVLGTDLLDFYRLEKTIYSPGAIFFKLEGLAVDFFNIFIETINFIVMSFKFYLYYYKKLSY